MAVSNYRSLQAFVAGADLSAAYGMAVKNDTTAEDRVILSAASAGTVGIVIEPAPQGGTVGVCCEQGVKVPARVSAAVAVGALVSVGADSKFKTAATGELAVGIADEAATAADQIITILYTPAGTVA